MRAHIRAQHFLARIIAQHPHHSVIHVKEPPFRRRKKQSFLDAVKKLAIPPLGLAPIGHILQHVNRSRIVF